MTDYMNKYVIGPYKKLGSLFSRGSASSAPEKVVETIIKHEYQKLEPFSYRQLPKMSRCFMKIAAISGLTAVIMSAYGSHGNL
jgi:hypothetical protein